MADNYQLPILDTINSSWLRVSGSKKTFWAALLIGFAISIGFGLLQKLTQHMGILNTIINIADQLIMFLIQLGIIYLGIQRALDAPINYNMMFSAFNKEIALKGIGLYFLQAIILLPFFILTVVAIVFLFRGIVTVDEAQKLHFITNFSVSAVIATHPVALIILLFAVCAGIYISVRLSLGMALVVDQHAGPLNAIALSFKATQSNFWNLFFISLLVFLIILISMIPLGIGLIWSLPFAYINYGMIYRRLLTNLQLPK